MAYKAQGDPTLHLAQLGGWVERSGTRYSGPPTLWMGSASLHPLYGPWPLISSKPLDRQPIADWSPMATIAPAPGLRGGLADLHLSLV
jgi:hypothetical protein